MLANINTRQLWPLQTPAGCHKTVVRHQTISTMKVTRMMTTWPPTGWRVMRNPGATLSCSRPRLGSGQNLASIQRIHPLVTSYSPPIHPPLGPTLYSPLSKLPPPLVVTRGLVKTAGRVHACVQMYILCVLYVICMCMCLCITVDFSP